MIRLLWIICILFQFFGFCQGVWTRFDLVRPWIGGWGSNGTTPYVKLNGLSENGPNVTEGANFGYSVANVLDVNGDGFEDIAVGAIGETVRYGSNSTQINAGGLYILFIGKNVTVNKTVHINGVENNGPQIKVADQFGYSLASLGDLDNDGVPDLAVGAPGSIISSVYILFLMANGTVRESVLVRGLYTSNGNSTNTNVNYVPNGPPITYGCRFGSALANIGDWDHDGVTDLAVTAVDYSGGTNLIYLLYMMTNGTVKGYSSFGPGFNGMPELLLPYSGFGRSITLLPDLDNNSIPELVIGAPRLYEAGSLNYDSGQSIICFMLANGSVNHTKIISENAGASLGTKGILPMVPYDGCGNSVITIGDINRDDVRQRQPTKPTLRNRKSVPDIIMGCSQSLSSGLPGRMMFVYLSNYGDVEGYTVIPALTDELVGPQLNPYDQFAQSLHPYYDVDKNGLSEILVGSPGNDDTGLDAGAIYVLFPRRRRYHYPPFDFLTFILLVTLIPGILCSMCIMGVIYFCWYFRRIPDEVEIIVKNSGLKIDPTKPRNKYQGKPNTVYCDEYTA